MEPCGKQDSGESNTDDEEVVDVMKQSLDEISEVWLTICKNLLERREVLVKTLEQVPELDYKNFIFMVETLKCESLDLQSGIDLAVTSQNERVNGLLKRQTLAMAHCKGKAEETIRDLTRKLAEEKANSYKALEEIKNQKEKNAELIKDLEETKHSLLDIKNRNDLNLRAIKMLKNKNIEMEAKVLTAEMNLTDFNGKINVVRNEHKSKEYMWLKEKEEFLNKIEQLELSLQNLNATNNELEIRCDIAEERCSLSENLTQETEKKLLTEILELKTQLGETFQELEKEKREKEHIQDELFVLRDHLSALRMESFAFPIITQKNHDDENAARLLNNLIERIDQFERDKIDQAIAHKETMADIHTLKEDHYCIEKQGLLLFVNELKLCLRVLLEENMVKDMQMSDLLVRLSYRD